MGELTAQYRSAQRRGLAAPAAGNLVAWTIGVRPVPSGWKPRELAGLLFLRWWAERHPDNVAEAEPELVPMSAGPLAFVVRRIFPPPSYTGKAS